MKQKEFLRLFIDKGAEVKNGSNHLNFITTVNNQQYRSIEVRK